MPSSRPSFLWSRASASSYRARVRRVLPSSRTPKRRSASSSRCRNCLANTRRRRCCSLNASRGNFLRGVYVRPFAHVEERAVAIERQRLQVLLVEQFLARTRACTVRSSRVKRCERRLRAGRSSRSKRWPLLQDLAHALLELREVLLGERRAQDEVVVQPVLDRRPETERRTRPQSRARPAPARARDCAACDTAHRPGSVRRCAPNCPCF